MQGKRYKFQGSKFYVGIGFGTPKIVTAITAADPAVVTSTAHGLVLGAVVKPTNIAGMTELEGNLYPIDNPSTNSFELAGVDSSTYDAFVVNSPNTAEVLPVTFSNFCELTGVNQQDGQASVNDVTTICSTAKEFELGLSDTGTMSLDFNWAGNQSVQAAMRAAKNAGEAIAFKIVFPKDGGTVVVLGFVQQTTFQGAVDGTWKATAAIKLTGDLFVLPAA